MISRLPIIPTVLVSAAIALMIGLGIWQLQRAEWKNALLAHYAEAENAGPVPFPTDPEEVEQALYRPSTVNCARVVQLDAMAGRNASGKSGWAEVARCDLVAGGQADIVLGWIDRPEIAEWSGGDVSGIIGPGRDGEARLVAAPPQAGLTANARPDPADLPNNHLSYAVQWFFFALTALVIYILALRRRD